MNNHFTRSKTQDQHQIKIESQNKKNIKFSVEHFDAFKVLDDDQKSQLLTSISLELLATACCLITNKPYLQELLACLNAQQSQLVFGAIARKQASKPNPLFILRVQKMIICLQTMFIEQIKDIDELSNSCVNEMQTKVLCSQNINFLCTEVKSKALFCEKALIEKIDRARKKDEEKYQRVLEAGALKKLYYPTNSSLEALNALMQTYPSFHKVIRVIKNSIQVSLLGNTPFFPYN